MLFTNQVISRINGFRFEVIIEEDAIGGCEYQAVISNDSKLWSKKVGLATDSYLEACEELDYYMQHGFRFGNVRFNPQRKAAVS